MANRFHLLKSKLGSLSEATTLEDIAAHPAVVHSEMSLARKLLTVSALLTRIPRILAIDGSSRRYAQSWKNK